MSEAGKAEVQDVRTATVEWRGLSFEIPRYRVDWPFEAAVAAEAEKWPTFIAAMLPDQALHQFKSMRPTQGDAWDLLNAISDALGFGEPGESPASAS